MAAGQLQLGRTGDRRFVNRRGHLDILRGDGPFAGEREAAAGAEVGRRVGRGRQPVPVLSGAFLQLADGAPVAVKVCFIAAADDA